MLMDVYKTYGIDGSEVEVALDKIGLNVNKNVIPDDVLPPFRPSGVRLGTPAITTRGLKPEHMAQLADWIVTAIKNRAEDKKLASMQAEVQAFARQFPMPSDIALPI
jgi:glycine hydroxymethyltransferase